MTAARRIISIEEFPGLGGVRSALAGADSNPVNILAYGNSITEGVGVSPNWEESWPTVLGESLNDLYSPSVTYGGRGYHPMRTTGDGGWTITNNSGSSNISTAGFASYTCNLFSGDTIDKTVGNFTYMTVVYTEFNTSFGGLLTAGEFTVDVDGSTEATVDTRNVSLADSENNYGKTVTIGPITPGVGDITLTTISGTICAIQGVFIYQGDPSAGGVYVWNGGRSSVASNSVVDASLGIAEYLSPDLIIIQHMYNDRIVDASTYTSRLMTIKGKIEAIDSTIPVILASEYQTTAWTTEGRWEALRNAARDFAAQSSSWSFLDLGGLIGSLGFNGTIDDPCSFLSDTNHAGIDGSSYIADAYLAALQGQQPTIWTC